MIPNLCYGCMQPKENPICEHCGYDERQQNNLHQLPLGTVLKGQYLVGKVLGQGGFGITYLGYNLYLKKTVAIKEYYPTGIVMRENSYSLTVHSCEGADSTLFQDNLRRFLREAQSLARLNNIPEVVQVQDFFPENGTGYIVMEYIQGMTLKERIRQQGCFRAEELLQIFRPILTCLHSVHQAGLVHRDISPDNIILLPDGKVKLLDFGAAHDYGEEANQRSTQAIMKQGFSPIEQYQSRGNLGPWTDVYSLCSTMYYCATGKVPTDAMSRLIDKTEIGWDSVPGLTAQQIQALRKGMEVQPRDRIPSVEELDRLLRQTESIQEPAPDRPQKKRFLPVAAALLVLAAAAAGFLLLPGKKQEAPPPTTEETTLQTTAPTETEAPTEGPKKPPALSREQCDRMLKFFPSGEYDSLASDLSINRDQVERVIFLDTLAEAPENAVNVSHPSNGKVFAWKKSTGRYYTIYIAAEGGVLANFNSDFLFHEYPVLSDIQFNGAFFTTYATSMRSMFSSCDNLETLDLSSFDTSCVTDMGHMFGSCDNLETVDVSSFDTSCVTDMGNMFGFCYKLEAVDVSGFDTSYVTDMSGMFMYCRKLETVDVSGFDTSCVTDMSDMFGNCDVLSELDVSGFDTALVTNFSGVFSDTPLLTNLEGSFDTSRAENAAGFMDPDDTFNGQPWRNIF